MSIKQLTVTTLVLSLSCVSLSISHANEASTPFNVLLALQPSCSITTANDVDFGTVDLNSPDDNGNTNVDVMRSTGLQYSVGLIPSDNSDIGDGQLSIASNPAEHVHYYLFKDAAHTNVWGDKVGINTTPGTGTGVNQTYSIYAHVPQSEFNHTVGHYTDTIAIHLTY